MERLELEACDEIVVTTLIENTIDAFMPDQGAAQRFRDGTAVGSRVSRLMEGGLVNEHPRSEHGFAALVSITAGDRRHTILFDAGRTPDGLAHNIRCFGIEPRDIEAIVVSHGHFDHATGLDGLSDMLRRSGLPILIHPDFWHRRRLRLPGREPWELPTTSRSALLEAGFDVIDNAQPSFVLDGLALVTGEIDRTTDFEPGFPFQEAWRVDHWEADPLVLDDQALILSLGDRGLVVFTGCGHAGIVNTLRHAQRITGIDRIHAVMGGLHLNGPLYEALIPQTCAALHEFAPAMIAPGHCTGWRALHRFGIEFPDVFVPNAVGTRYVLRAEDSAPGR